MEHLINKVCGAHHYIQFEQQPAYASPTSAHDKLSIRLRSSSSSSSPQPPAAGSILPPTSVLPAKHVTLSCLQNHETRCVHRLKEHIERVRCGGGVGCHVWARENNYPLSSDRGAISRMSSFRIDKVTVNVFKPPCSSIQTNSPSECPLIMLVTEQLRS